MNNDPYSGDHRGMLHPEKALLLDKSHQLLAGEGVVVEQFDETYDGQPVYRALLEVEATPGSALARFGYVSAMVMEEEGYTQSGGREVPARLGVAAVGLNSNAARFDLRTLSDGSIDITRRAANPDTQPDDASELAPIGQLELLELRSLLHAIEGQRGEGESS